MSISHTLTQTWTDNATTVKAVRKLTGASGSGLDLFAPAGSANVPGAFALARAKAMLVVVLADQPVTFLANGTSAVQTVAVTGAPTGGTFTLTFGGLTTAPLAYDATAAQVQAALLALSSVGAGNLAASGGPLPGSPVSAAFQGALGAQPLAAMTADGSGLTGGSSPAVAVATATAGVAPDASFDLVPNVPLVWDYQGYYAQPFPSDLTSVRVTNAGAADANVSVRALSQA